MTAPPNPTEAASADAAILWTPSAERIAGARLTQFTSRLREKYHQAFPDYWSLWRWSIANKEIFWRELWDECSVVGEQGARTLIDGHLMPGAQWFPDAKLNFAENFLQYRGHSDAIVFWTEAGDRGRLSRDELRVQVARVQRALLERGIGPGDVVASTLPNCPEAAIAMLATTSIGATWSSTSPDFGAQGVLDRFAQISPKVLFAVSGCFYNGKWIDTLPRVEEVVAQLPSLKTLVLIEPKANPQNLAPFGDSARYESQTWTRFAANDAAEPTFTKFAFNHPLYIVFSSGTTGLPKCIIHGAGGTLLQLVKEHALHGDHRAGDRVFYFSTTGWVMWNWLLGGLTQGATCLLYDGSPFANDGRILFDLAETERATQFGVGAKYIDAIKKLGVSPMTTHDLSALRTVYSTGSPLSPESFDYVYQHIKSDVHLASISGGTDIMSCFALGNPTLPVRRGEMQCRGLGMAVDVWDDDARSVAGEMGELVCAQTFPSMPLGFGNDADGNRYRAAYFERFPGVWTHGDWCMLTPNDGVVITGRSDATLNPGGVRIGTAEIYRQVETIDEVVESIAIGQVFNHDTRVVLFVKLRDGIELNVALTDRIKRRIKEHTTPRHVPAVVVQVLDIPRTKSNKIVELAVRDVVHGRPVKNIEALANPEALAHFRNRPELLH
ncbi:MAG: acetoacetate--CoA ligase [Betaproteobacteria bacterium]|nr:MAG: acetoacetate--CoA ligase [Betaproteobacteria bacterium]